MEVNATIFSTMAVSGVSDPIGSSTKELQYANKFNDLLEAARSGVGTGSVSRAQKSELWDSLKVVDRAVRNVDAEIAAAIVAPKPDIVSAHLMTMQLEQKTHVAKMMMETSIACAGSLKTTLTQVLKNQ